MARPGYNEDNTLNTSVYSPPVRNTGNNNNNNNNNNNVTAPVPEFNVSTGMGVEDLKVQAQQKRAAEERKNYENKLIALASSGMSSPGPLMNGLDFSFGGREDPSLGFIPSGDVPTSDFQKALFLTQNDIGNKTNIFYDENRNVVSPTDDYFSGKEGIAGLGQMMTDEETGNKSFQKTGLGQYLLGDVWNDALDPGGLYPDPNNPYLSGDFMADKFKKGYSNYFDQNYYGSDYWDDYLGEYYGPSTQTDYSKMKRWDQRSLGEILQEGPAGFGDLQRIYGEELTDTSANPFAAVAAYNKKGSYTPSFGETITEYIA